MSELCMSCSKVLTAPEDDTEDVEPRWQPDEQLVPAILAGSRKRMADLGDNDRAWVVAGMTLAGIKAEDIAMRLKCSLRLVRSIKSLPLTKACVYAQTETANWINENRLTTSALRAAEVRLETMQRELGRTREKLTRLIDAHVIGTPTCGRCGTPWDKGNTYFEGTKRRCRNCNRLKQQAFRERRKTQDLDTNRNPSVGYDSVTLTVEGHEGELVIGPGEQVYEFTDTPQAAELPVLDGELIELSRAGALPRHRGGGATARPFPSSDQGD